MKRTKAGGCDDSTWRKRMEFSEAFPADLETVAQAEFPADGRRSSQSEAKNNKQRCQVWAAHEQSGVALFWTKEMTHVQ